MGEEELKNKRGRNKDMGTTKATFRHGDGDGDGDGINAAAESSFGRTVLTSGFRFESLKFPIFMAQQ